MIKDRIFISIAYRLCLTLSLNCFGLSKMAAVFSLQVFLVATLLFLWCIFDSLSRWVNNTAAGANGLLALLVKISVFSSVL